MDTVAAQMRHFIDCVKTDTRPLNSGQDAVEVMKNDLWRSWMLRGSECLHLPATPAGGSSGAGAARRSCPARLRAQDCGAAWGGWSLTTEEVMRV